eukprot:tig00000403_g284.t1
MPRPASRASPKREPGSPNRASPTRAPGSPLHAPVAKHGRISPIKAPPPPPAPPVGGLVHSLSAPAVGPVPSGRRNSITSSIGTPGRSGDSSLGGGSQGGSLRRFRLPEQAAARRALAKGATLPGVPLQQPQSLTSMDEDGGSSSYTSGNSTPHGAAPGPGGVRFDGLQKPKALPALRVTSDSHSGSTLSPSSTAAALSTRRKSSSSRRMSVAGDPSKPLSTRRRKSMARRSVEGPAQQDEGEAGPSWDEDLPYYELHLASAAPAWQHQLASDRRTVRVYLCAPFPGMGAERAAVLGRCVPRLRAELEARRLHLSVVPEVREWAEADATELEIELRAGLLSHPDPHARPSPASPPRSPRPARCAPPQRADASRVYFLAGEEEEEAAGPAGRGWGGWAVAPGPAPGALEAEALLEDLLALVDEEYPGGWNPQGGPRCTGCGRARGVRGGAAAPLRARPGDFVPSPSTPRPPARAPPRLRAPGSGKGALLAAWGAWWAQRCPGDLLIAHFVAVTRHTRRVGPLFEHVAGEIRARFPSVGEFNMGGREQLLIDRFGTWLSTAAASVGARLLLVVDGVDRLADDAAAQALAWVPAASPHLRILLSCRPASRAHAAASARPHLAVGVAPPTRRGGRGSRRRSCGRRGGPPGGALERLLEAPQCGSPLFLQLALAELTAAAPAALPAALERCLASPDPAALYAAARLLGFHGPPAPPPPTRPRGERLGADAAPTPLLWASFVAHAGAALIESNGYITLAHRSLGEAVESMYLFPVRGGPASGPALEAGEAGGGEEGEAGGGEEGEAPGQEEEGAGQRVDEERRWHSILGVFFAGLPPSDRRAEEAPWQLAQARDGERLVSLLSELDMLRRLPKETLIRLWVETNRATEASRRYRAAAEACAARGEQEPARLATDLQEAGVLLRLMGHLDNAMPFIRDAIKIWEKTHGSTDVRLARAMEELANLHQDRNEAGEALLLRERAIAVYEAALGRHHPDVANSLNDLALMYLNREKWAEAEPLLLRVLAIFESIHGPSHPKVALVLNSLGTLYKAQAKYAKAETFFKRSLAMREAALGKASIEVANSLGNLAALYNWQGKYSSAEAFYKRSLAIREEALGAEHADVAHVLHVLGIFMLERGRHAEGTAYLERALRMREAAVGPKGSLDTYNAAIRLAKAYEKCGRREEALELRHRHWALMRERLFKDVAATVEARERRVFFTVR